MSAVTVLQLVLSRTFEIFRTCGCGRKECQALWISSWTTPDEIVECVHPEHAAHSGGFNVSSAWLTAFWLDLARRNCGVRVQVHTHPGAAFHSTTDDRFPIIHSVGFLSLVIPDFACGPVGFDRAYLCEIADDGSWREVSVEKRLRIRQ